MYASFLTETLDPMCRLLAMDANVVVINVKYVEL